MKWVAEYAAGQITFADFARANESDWRAMARYLLRRFPTDLDEQDVVQELLFASWLAMRKFDPARGVAPDRYCSFNTLVRTRKRMRSQTRPAEEVMGYEAEAPVEPVPASQLTELVRTERLRELVERCGSLKDAVVLLAFFNEEDRGSAAATLYRDPETRRLCRFGSESEAHRKVRQSLNRFKPKGTKCQKQTTHR